MIKKTLAIICVFSTTLSLADTTGLKKVNFQNETSDKQDEGTGTATLSPEESKKLTESIELIKKKQAESEKALIELDQDE
jgi:hypothetical protein